MNIVFDFGAVMVNWRPQEVVHQHFPVLASTPDTAAELAKQFFSHSDWQAFDAGKLSAKEIAQLSAQRLELDERAVQTMIDAIEDHITPIESSVALLHQLFEAKTRKAYKLYYLSNMPVPYARGLERHAFMRCFDGGIFSGDVGLIKPQPEIFQLLQSRYGLQPDVTLFIDDHAANIAAAQQGGWQTLHLTDPARLASRLLTRLNAAVVQAIVY
jgi:putative hydrolase of the HAD superfamily